MTVSDPGGVLDRVRLRTQTHLLQAPCLRHFWLFMLTHGKGVRRVSFLLGALEPLFVMAFRRGGKVSFLVRSGYFLTFISVKYSIYYLF